MHSHAHNVVMMRAWLLAPDCRADKATHVCRREAPRSRLRSVAILVAEITRWEARFGRGRIEIGFVVGGGLALGNGRLESPSP
jgi:hypothetical protein